MGEPRGCLEPSTPGSEPGLRLSVPTARRTRVGWLLDGAGWPWFGSALDALCVGGGVAVAQRATGAAGFGQWWPVVVLSLGGLALARTRARRIDVGILDDLWPMLAALSVAGMVALVFGALLERGGSGTGAIAVAWSTTLALATLSHGATHLLRRRARLRGLSSRRTLIVGAGAVGARLARRLERYPQYGLRPVGFLDWEPPAPDAVGGRDLPVVGRPDDLAETIARTGAEQVALAFASRPDWAMVPLLRACEALGVEVIVVPRLFEYAADRVAYDPIGGLPLLRIRSASLPGWKLDLKHALDRAVALVLIICLLPVFALIVAALATTTTGPLLFRQRRVGRDGREFDLLKFRTMARSRAEAVEPVPEPALDQAPGGVHGADRRTRIGKLLRRTSLDELPQLVNVLRGDMSLVGPRPERPEFVAIFNTSVDRYAERHRVRAGITGLAQVRGLRGRTSLTERVELDNFYIDHWSLVLDAKILARTAFALFRVPE